MKQIIVVTLLVITVSSVYSQERPFKVQPMSSSNTEQRVALVIGNGLYANSPLANPVNDARDIAQTLREAGFEVMLYQNLNQNEMKREIREFGKRIKGGDTALFYYAGHGLQVDGHNYLIPIAANIESEEQVEYEAVDTGLILAEMEAASNKLNIVILDACRNNPFARSFRSNLRGLAVMNAPIGTILAFATAPGSVASDGSERNGLYTQELIKNIRIPGTRIEDIFKKVRSAVRQRSKGKQIPWESSSLEGDFYFYPTKQIDGQPTTTSSLTMPEKVLNWQGYKIQLNLSLSQYDKMAARLGEIGIPLSKEFAYLNPRRFLLTFGRNVPVENLQQLIRVLTNFGLDSVQFLRFKPYDNSVYIGSISYEGQIAVSLNTYEDLSICSLDEQILKRLLDPNLSTQQFINLVVANSKVVKQKIL